MADATSLTPTSHGLNATLFQIKVLKDQNITLNSYLYTVLNVSPYRRLSHKTTLSNKAVQDSCVRGVLYSLRLCEFRGTCILCRWIKSQILFNIPACKMTEILLSGYYFSSKTIIRLLSLGVYRLFLWILSGRTCIFSPNRQKLESMCGSVKAEKNLVSTGRRELFILY